MSFFSDASLVMIPSGYKTSKVYSVVPTSGDGDLVFSRSNDTATRVASSGLIEKVRTNLALRSQSFATSAVWTTTSGTITDNAGTAPDGTNTASKIVAINTDPYCYQPLTLSGSVVASCYIKGIGSSIGKNGSIRAAGSITNFTITGDWQRVSVAHTAGGAQNYGVETPEIAVVSDEVLLWGFQVETGDIATDYIATTTASVSVGPVANVPRLDYLGSSCPRLLLEPQRTNLVTYSEQFDNTAWTKGGTTISANTSATLDPSGYNGSDKLVEDSSTGVHRVFNISSVVVSDSVATTYSVFAKAAERTQIYLRDNDIVGARFNLSTGAVISTEGTATATITNYGNGWYRCTITRISSTTSGRVIVYLDNGGDSYTGNGTSGVYIFGAQIETSTAYATSYIPTLGASVTRGADFAVKTGISSLIGSTEGVLYAEVDYKTTTQSGPVLLDVNDNDLTNRIVLLMGNGVVGGFAQGTTLITYTLPSFGTYKIAFAYKSGNFALYVNGVQRGTNSTALTFSGMNQLFLGQTFTLDNTQPVNGISQALLFKTRLSNDSLAALTA